MRLYLVHLSLEVGSIKLLTIKEMILLMKHSKRVMKAYHLRKKSWKTSWFNPSLSVLNGASRVLESIKLLRKILLRLTTPRISWYKSQCRRINQSHSTSALIMINKTMQSWRSLKSSRLASAFVTRCEKKRLQPGATAIHQSHRLPCQSLVWRSLKTKRRRMRWLRDRSGNMEQDQKCNRSMQHHLDQAMISSMMGRRRLRRELSMTVTSILVHPESLPSKH